MLTGDPKWSWFLAEVHPTSTSWKRNESFTDLDEYSQFWYGLLTYGFLTTSVLIISHEMTESQLVAELASHEAPVASEARPNSQIKPAQFIWLAFEPYPSDKYIRNLG